jgi:hypothetical protein
MFYSDAFQARCQAHLHLHRFVSQALSEPRVLLHLYIMYTIHTALNEADTA